MFSISSNFYGLKYRSTKTSDNTSEFENRFSALVVFVDQECLEKRPVRGSTFRLYSAPIPFEPN